MLKTLVLVLVLFSAQAVHTEAHRWGAIALLPAKSHLHLVGYTGAA